MKENVIAWGVLCAIVTISFLIGRNIFPSPSEKIIKETEYKTIKVFVDKNIQKCLDEGGVYTLIVEARKESYERCEVNKIIKL
jgi:hypothetical protein